jgi:branched-chain amino acid transport system substrate-binding protein
VGVLNTSIPVGSVNFTTASLVAKQTGVNALIGELGNASNFALATAYQQEGVKPKVVIFPSGYEQDVIGSPTWSTVQGDYFLSAFRPFSLPNAGTRAMAAAMQKYEHWNKSQFPNLSQYDAWLGADLMIRGLTMAGKNPTRATVIKDLRSIKSYNGNGLLPKSIDYSTVFGHFVSPDCQFFLKAATKGFVPTAKAPQCGTYIPGSDTAPTSGTS